MTAVHGVLQALPSDHHAQLMAYANQVTFPRDTRIFEEGRTADRFWIIRSGAVGLDLHVPGRRAPFVETLTAGELLGWSWLFPPDRWHLGAQTLGQVRAYEFNAPAVLTACEKDTGFGFALARVVAEVVAHRLTAARTRLLDLYGPQGSGIAI